MHRYKEHADRCGKGGDGMKGRPQSPRGFATPENTPAFKGKFGSSMQAGRFGKKKKPLTEREKMKRGLDQAKGSNLKFIPNDEE